MKYWQFIAIALAFVFLIYYYFAVYQDGQKDYVQVDQSQTAQKQWETYTSEQEPVLIKITPTQLGSGQSPWKFMVTFTTHSGDLDQDPTKVAVLVDDTGNTYRPISWEGPQPGGHHIEGSLLFNAVEPVPNYVELKILDVGGISERIFKWSLE